MIPQLTQAELLPLVDRENLPALNRWLARGDGVAVYEDVCLDSWGSNRGRRFVSFGSPAAQFVTPPQRFPDTPTEINWRLTLVGTYQGAPLPL